MPTWPASRSTAVRMCATSSSARALARRRRGLPPAPSPASSCSGPACGSRATSSRLAQRSCADGTIVTFEQAAALAADAPLRCVDEAVERQMIDEIDRARETGDTKGGAFEVIVTGVAGRPRQLRAVGPEAGRPARARADVDPRDQGRRHRSRSGSRHAPGIARPRRDSAAPGGNRVTGVSRPTNNAGGLEGGVTNGEDLRVSAWMKPISTLMKPLRSVDLTTMGEASAAIERSDVCAVPAAAVVGEAMVALVLADALTEKFGGDSVAEIERSMRRGRDRSGAICVRRELSAQQIRDISQILDKSPDDAIAPHGPADSAIRRAPAPQTRCPGRRSSTTTSGGSSTT